MSATLEVVTTGPQLLVQDLGRPGWAHLGVGRSGAADRASLRLANRLVGNPEGAAGLESLLGGATLEARTATVVAVTGAAVGVRVDERELHLDGPLSIRAGSVLRLGAARTGLRAYLAVRGGLVVAETLGSMATDTLSGLGPGPLVVGDVLHAGRATVGWPVVDVAAVARASRAGPLVLRVVPGPRQEWFTADALAALRTAVWTVSPESDRVGSRLEGPALARAVAGELPSEPMVRGAVQVPPHGRPVVMGPDHPVTGGYPVIATVVDHDADLLAQARPGDPVTFTPTDR